MRGTRIINWGTPKRIQMLKQRTSGRFRPKKTLKYCKKTKGEHDVVWKDWKGYSWTTGSYRNGRCRLCGKKFSEYKDE